MLKKIGFSAAALAFGFFGLVANGCSSSTTTVVDDGGSTAKDASKEATAPADTGPATCYDLTGSFTYNFGAPVAYQNVCTSDQISGYLAACFSPGTAATCETFINANPYCSFCLAADEPAADSGVAFDAGPDGGVVPYPALVTIEQTSGLAQANIDGCIAALSTGTDSCKLLDDQLSTCISTSCNTCTQGDDAAQTACLTAAENDTAGCSSQFVLDSTCQTALTASQSANAAACGGNGTTFQDQYTAVATTLCGAHP